MIDSDKLFFNRSFIKYFKLVIFFLFTLYIWHQSHFQFQEYWSEPYRTLMYYFLTFVLIFGSGLALFDKYPYQNVFFVFVFITVVIFYGVLQYLIYDESLLLYLKTAVALIAALQIIKSKENINLFVKLSFSLGMILILLNMVTLLHWYGVLELSFETIQRVGGALDRPDLNPYSFGIFGRTESYVIAGNIAPRLQGFSSEPLHWAYFVLMTFSFGVLLYSQTTKNKVKFLLLLCFVSILIYSYFMKSTTLLISIIYIVACIATVYFTSKIAVLRDFKKIIVFFVLVIVPGFVIPFMLVLTSNALEFFQNDNIFNEGSNWQGKIEFLYLGTSLFTNVLPSLSSYLSVSHNFILDFYLKLGYILLIPLIVFLFEYINITISNNRYINTAVIIFIITVSLVSPLALFYPSGAVWAVVIFGAAYHAKLTGSKFNEE